MEFVAALSFIPSELVVLATLADGAAAVDVDVSGMEEDARPVVGDDVPAEVLSAAGSRAGVEVEETNGGAFSMYEPVDWTA
jgi:hypothetical protein